MTAEDLWQENMKQMATTDSLQTKLEDSEKRNEEANLIIDKAKLEFDEFKAALHKEYEEKESQTVIGEEYFTKPRVASKAPTGR